jgi:poly-gamma-glutamate capsule biosynthesis protein CapA/YwtB (metallophosphatase superfamily)
MHRTLSLMKFLLSAKPRRRTLGLLGAAAAGLVVVAVVGSGVMNPSAVPSEQSRTAISDIASLLAPASAAPAPAATPTLTAIPAPPTPAPLVPVVSFWSTRRDISRVDIAALWAGKPDAAARTGFKSVAVASQDGEPLASALGVGPGPSVTLLSSIKVKAAVAASATTLGLIPAEDVSPDVLALSVDGLSLFTSERIKDLTRWPLNVMSATPTRYLPGNIWTLAAGGDVNLAREVYVNAVTKKLGPDYPWSAGYAVIRGHDCCDLKGGPLLSAHATGSGGILRSRLADADLAIVNLEGPAPDNHVNNRDSLNFTFDPALLVGLKHAGIDAVSLANNHINNGGAQGVIQTIQHLDAIGLPHAGAGANAAIARQPVWLAAAGLKVAFLAYSAVGTGNWAGTNTPGAAPLHLADVTADIKAARAAGAGIVIVMPHWGEEYSYSLSATQKGDAAAFVAAGADLVLGSHSHWVGGIETIAGPNGPAFIDYSLGDFLFNLNHDTQSQEAVLATMTFSGTRLVQVQLDPTVMIAGARVGLLSPAGAGKSVLDAIRAASRRLPGF